MKQTAQEFGRSGQGKLERLGMEKKKNVSVSGGGGASGSKGRHGEDAFDQWLIRELKTLYADTRQEPLPDEISDLARQLEQKLGGKKGGTGD